MYMTYWGYHLLLHAKACVPATIRSKSLITEFSKTLVKEIDMVPYGNPKVVLFGSGNKKGYTLMQLIETSNICAHFTEENDSMYLDVFSCKPFDKSVVNNVVKYHFGPESIDAKMIVRDVNKPFDALQ